MKIAIPGELTRARSSHSGSSIRSSSTWSTRSIVIIEAVQKGKVDAGLLDPRRAALLQGTGLDKVLDLGEWWHEKTGLPLPMGGNAIRRSRARADEAGIASPSPQHHVFNGEPRGRQYAMQFARDMAPEVADRFVAMWVNELTLDYGERGKEGVRRLLDEGYKAGIILHKVEVEFVD